jgi:hypothetical protein
MRKYTLETLLENALSSNERLAYTNQRLTDYIWELTGEINKKHKILVRSWERREKLEQELREFRKKLQIEKLGEEIINNHRTDN